MYEEFDYETAFCRNIGWLTSSEQAFLRTKTLAIAGMGGVGGVHLLTLVRLGIEKFHIADMDIFELHNFNRQIGANITTIKQAKVSVLEKMAKEINPNVQIKTFPNGIDATNIDEFLKNVDIYVDGLDFFVLDIRAEVFKAAYARNIPAITAGPIGMGTAYLIFMPGKMSFEKYFRFKQFEKTERILRFYIGLNPTLTNRHYLVKADAIDFQNERGPSTIMGCQLCAGIIGTEVLKILLNRGPIYAAPYYHLFDAYMNKHKIGWMPFGNLNPIQLLKMHFIRAKHKIINKPAAENLTTIEKILDLAKWAPSGDNIQPWRFEINNDEKMIVHICHEKDSLYDYAGIPTKISCGFLLETMRIAASLYSFAMTYQVMGDRIEVQWIPQPAKSIDELVYCIKQRSVDRRSYQRRALSEQSKATLMAAVGDEFSIIWFESFSERLALAKLTMLGTYIRMSMPELYAIHREIIVQGKQAEQGIPMDAIGMNFFAKGCLKWSLKSWQRINFLNNVGGLRAMQFELDLLPAINSSAHFMLVPNKDTHVQDPDFYFRVGAAMQRFWLTATQLNLVMQPNFSPLLFSYYADHKIAFTENKKLLEKAAQLTEKLHKIDQGQSVLFLGRIGYPQHPALAYRSMRMPLNSLIISNPDQLQK